MEGDSAAGPSILVRDSNYHAIYPISGKFVNSFELLPSDLIKKKSISELLSIIGIKLSSPNIDELKYGKIAIFCDADPDGDCITALLINFFFKYCPNLFEHKKIYKAISYLILAKHRQTGEKKKFFSVEEFELETDYEVLEYNKGLGGLDDKEYREAMDSLVCIEKDELTNESLKIAFSADASLRKKWLVEEEN